MTGTRRTVAALFLLPALVLLGALVVYPIGYSVFRSFFDQSGDGFAGFDNYKALFTDDGIRTALKNNVIWVVFAPTVATALGLIFAVLTERVRWGTAFKLVVFMPMAISMLAAGIIFRLVYDQDPDQGVANAVWVGVHDTFAAVVGVPEGPPGPGVAAEVGGGRRASSPRRRSSAGDTGHRSRWWAWRPTRCPATRRRPWRRRPDPGKVTGTAWQDFTRGKGVGKLGALDPTELGYPGMKIEAVKDGKVVASADGRAPTAPSPCPRRPTGPNSGSRRATSRRPYNGLDWLGPSLVTPGDHRVVHLDVGRVRDGADRGRARGHARGNSWRRPGSTARTSGRCSAGSRCRCWRRSSRSSPSP